MRALDGCSERKFCSYSRTYQKYYVENYQQTFHERVTPRHSHNAGAGDSITKNEDQHLLGACTFRLVMQSVLRNYVKKFIELILFHSLFSYSEINTI